MKAKTRQPTRSTRMTFSSKSPCLNIRQHQIDVIVTIVPSLGEASKPQT